MIVISVQKKMLNHKVCCVLAFALVDSLWVQAFPSIATSNKNAIYNSFEALKCPENEFLNHEGKACEPTCEDPIRLDSCTEKKIIACECDDGYVRNATGACIRPEKCLHQLPPKSGNTLFASGSNKHSGVIIEAPDLIRKRRDDSYYLKFFTDEYTGKPLVNYRAEYLKFLDQLYNESDDES